MSKKPGWTREFRTQTVELIAGSNKRWALTLYLTPEGAVSLVIVNLNKDPFVEITGEELDKLIENALIAQRLYMTAPLRGRGGWEAKINNKRTFERQDALDEVSSFIIQHPQLLHHINFPSASLRKLLDYLHADWT